MAALLAAAVARHQHAGGIQAGLAEEAHLRGAHAGVGPRFDGARPAREPARMGHRIVVQGGQIRRGGGAKPLVDGRAEAGVARIFDHARARSFLRPEPKEDFTRNTRPPRLISLKESHHGYLGLWQKLLLIVRRPDSNRWHAYRSSATAIPTRPDQTNASDSPRKKRSLPRCSCRSSPAYGQTTKTSFLPMV